MNRIRIALFAAAALPVCRSALPPGSSLAFQLLPKLGINFRGTKGLSTASMSCDACDDKDMEDYGFARKEMFSAPLAGTLKRYDGHIFIPLKQPPSDWPSDALGVTTTNGLAIGTYLSKAIKKAIKSMPEGTPEMRVTPCHALASDQEGDIIYFPPSWLDASKRTPRAFTAPIEEALQLFVDEVIVKGNTESAAIPSKPLTGKQIFVCSHTQRDKRCGVCGPPLIAQLSSALGDAAQVRACSHVGGHAYAGNVLMYTTEMDWYGYVKPSDVPAFVEAASGKGHEAVEVKLWRGRMGMTEEEVKAVAEAKGAPV